MLLTNLLEWQRRMPILTYKSSNYKSLKINKTMEQEYPKLIGSIHLIALLGSKKYQICEKEKADYFANVKFWDKDDEELRGDFQVFINLTP